MVPPNDPAAALSSEMKRLTARHDLLLAQVAILRDEFSKLARQMVSGNAANGELLLAAIDRDIEWQDSKLGMTPKDAITASLKAQFARLNLNQDLEHSISAAQADYAATKAREYALLVAELNREQTMMNLFSMKLQDDLKADDDSAKASLETDAYFNALDAEPALPGDPLEWAERVALPGHQGGSPLKDGEGRVKPHIPLIMSRRELASMSEPPPDPCSPAAPEPGVLEFFHTDTGTPSPSTPPETGPTATASPLPRRYGSMHSTLHMEMPDGRKLPLLSIVDSGAAWCALRLATLKSRFPELVSTIQPSSMRFRDAQGHLMSLAGQVRLKLWIGPVRVETTAFVFNQLGAEFLLGANVLVGDGCVINCSSQRLYVAGDETGGLPMTSGPPPESILATSTCTQDSDACACDPSCTDENLEGQAIRLTCNRDRCVLVITEKGSDTTVPCEYQSHPKVSLAL